MTSPSQPEENTYRTKIDIMASILQIANGGSRKTRLMYHGNLSYNRLQSCLKELTGRGLIELTKGENDSVLYQTTSKGSEFVTAYKELKRLIT